ncbi:MAG: XRE family transcriptional regulator [Clostridiales Family XIII bacterium]|jgi:transcriptional regulator with XRE-family HTH domain|nr:XRE family transcriptional regulator [Clostridiales Family XIII bacterium]
MADFGEMIKALRKEKHMTLRDLSKKCNLSIGFLSQLERGLTTIAVDSLQEIAIALGVDLSYFFTVTNESNHDDKIIRSYERTVSFSEKDKYIHQYLSSNITNHKIFPEIELLVPEENMHQYKDVIFSHKGEEFIYVIEGILTVNYDHKIFKMHPGDSLLMHSTVAHNWYNSTNQMVKILVVRYPNPFTEENIIHEEH